MLQRTFIRLLLPLLLMGSPSLAQKKTSDTCHLLVSLYSIGTGINHSASDSLKAVLKKYHYLSSKMKIDTMPWGREGEVDFCFRFQKLSASRKKRVIREIKRVLKDQQYVHLNENKPPLHPKKR